MNSYNIRDDRSILWFFRLLLIFVATLVVLLLMLRINDTVAIKEGLVIAYTPQSDLIAPVDARIIMVKVREGQVIKKGDTLMQLANPDLLRIAAKNRTEIEYLRRQVASGHIRPASNDYALQLLTAEEVNKKIESDLSQLNVVAESAGRVNYVFNASNVVGKGELLASIVPQTDRYYARITLPERDMPYIHPGMLVQLKLDAYHGMEHGLLQGRISYVSERKQADHFFALVDINDQPKWPLRAGYTLSGEIILRRLSLYRYFLKKLITGE